MVEAALFMDALIIALIVIGFALSRWNKEEVHLRLDDTIEGVGRLATELLSRTEGIRELEFQLPQGSLALIFGGAPYLYLTTGAFINACQPLSQTRDVDNCVSIPAGDPITDLQPDHPNVVVLRTFSKAFGLAALRTGYAVADPDVVIELDKVLIAFAVNHLAQVASLAAIAARDEVQAVVDRITAERDRVVASLRADGWDLPDAHANFVYLPLGSRTDVVFPEMEKRGVVVRPFPGVGMRVTIGTPAQNDRFLATLAEVAAGS